MTALHLWLGVLQLAVLLAGVALWPAIEARVVARAEGRAGPPTWEGLQELWTLVRRSEVLPAETTRLGVWAPWVAWATVVAAALACPLGAAVSPLGDGADIGAWLGLLVLARLAALAAELDGGDARALATGAQGAWVAALAWPALALALAALALDAGSLEFERLVRHAASGRASPAWTAAALALGFAGLAEADAGLGGGPGTMTLSRRGGRARALLLGSAAARRTLVVAVSAALILPDVLAEVPEDGLPDGIRSAGGAALILGIVCSVAALTAIAAVAAGRARVARPATTAAAALGLAAAALLWTALTAGGV